MIKLYSADWCTACNTLKRNIDTSSIEVVNVDHEPDETERMGIRSIPTMIKFNSDGEEVERITGAISKDTFERWVDGN